MRYFIRYVVGAVVLLGCAASPGVRVARAQQTGSQAARPAGQQKAPGGTAGKGADAGRGPGASKTGAPLDLRVRASESAIDASIPADPAVQAILAPYSVKVRELETPIGKLAGDLKRGGMGGGSLGNFVADALRERAQVKLGKPVLLSVINSSGLRKNSITAGDISTSDIYELLPFENALVTLDLTGEQLRRFLDVTVARRNAQSGARITYRSNEKKVSEIVTVRLGAEGAEKEIDPAATYTIVTIDYLVKRGGDYSVLQEAKNVRPLGLTMRDAVLDYVKAETAAGRPLKAKLDGRFRYDKTGATKPEGDEDPQ
ncbi:MAG TPA: 5'-nucleotidase C-terminal domain-containing protein [Pyrinomonadaceae bacterium]